MSHHRQWRWEKKEVPGDVMRTHWTKLKVQIQSYLPDSVDHGSIVPDYFRQMTPLNPCLTRLSMAVCVKIHLRCPSNNYPAGILPQLKMDLLYEIFPFLRCHSPG